MALTARNLGDKELAVFDDAARTLYLIPDRTSFDLARGVKGLDALVAAGKAHRFNQETLSKISQAMNKMVLLDCGHTT
jgi:hypothetical protein